MPWLIIEKNWPIKEIDVQRATLSGPIIDPSVLLFNVEFQYVEIQIAGIKTSVDIINSHFRKFDILTFDILTFDILTSDILT
jgi:hypothetical protein